MGSSPILKHTCKPYGGRLIIDEQGNEFCAFSEITPEVVKEIAKDLPLDSYGKSYRQGIPQCGTDPMCLQTQALYMLSNVEMPETPEEALSLAQMEVISRNASLEPFELPLNLESDPSKMVLDETEYGRIMMGFERMTENKVNIGNPLTLEDYQRYADRYNVPIEKVLVASDWSKEALSNEVIQAREKAKDIVQIDW